jgi:hypothetical protein
MAYVLSAIIIKSEDDLSAIILIWRVFDDQSFVAMPRYGAAPASPSEKDPRVLEALAPRRRTPRALAKCAQTALLPAAAVRVRVTAV